jgi:hypothetical protein
MLAIEGLFHGCEAYSTKVQAGTSSVVPDPQAWFEEAWLNRASDVDTLRTQTRENRSGQRADATGVRPVFSLLRSHLTPPGDNPCHAAL